MCVCVCVCVCSRLYIYIHIYIYIYIYIYICSRYMFCINVLYICPRLPSLKDKIEFSL